MRNPWVFVGTLLFAVLMCLLVLFGAGCSLITSRIGPELAKGVNRYCETPAAERELVRDQVNEQIAPHRLELTCAELER